ncbi:MAG: GntR family transcriptional regulator [Acutalibacteraceae bacterium]
MEELKYIIVADELRKDIVSGKYSSGERLPSDNELVARTGYSRQTVRKALSMLENEGCITRVRGSGTYVSSSLTKREKTHNIGVITTYIGEYIFPSILQGIDSELTKKGYTSMLQATYNRFDNERRILKSMLHKPIDGLIIEGTKTALPNPNIDIYNIIYSMGIPIVFINGCYSDISDAVYVVADDVAGGEIACKSLIDSGCQSIAGVFKSDDIQGHRRYQGYVNALLESGLGVEDDKVFWYTTETKDRVLKTVLGSVNGCDSIVCYNDEVALYFAKEMAKRKDSERLRLASFDNSTYAHLSPIPFLSLNNPKEKIGALAAKKITEMIEKGKSESEVLPWSF